jgi:rare lipoprotein A (peptidoglycan hydrolase)
MHPWRTLASTLVLSAGIWAFSDQALAQSFDERWSIVPKANAEEPTAPPPPAREAPQQQTDPGEGNAASEPSVGLRAAQPVRPMRSEKDGNLRRAFSGRASYISYPGGKTASGAPYRPHDLTVAHRTLPFGTRLRVTDVKTGKHVQVTVNDRGPFARGRVLDLSRGAAQALGMMDRGVIQVRAEVVSPGKPAVLARGP